MQVILLILSSPRSSDKVTVVFFPLPEPLEWFNSYSEQITKGKDKTPTHNITAK